MTPIPIIIPHFGDPHYTDRCVRSVLNSDVPVEVVVVDDDPRNRWSHPKTEYVQHPTNRGTTSALNSGVEWVRGRTDAATPILLINNDIVVRRDTARLLAEAVSEEYPYCGAAELPDVEFNPESLFGPETAPPSFSERDYNSCFAVHSSLFDRIGLFDDSMILTYSDMDFIHRFEQAGYRRRVGDHIKVFHGRSVTRRALPIEDNAMLEAADAARFASKWSTHPEVLRQHGGANAPTLAKVAGNIARFNTQGEKIR